MYDCVLIETREQGTCVDKLKEFTGALGKTGLLKRKGQTIRLQPKDLCVPRKNLRRRVKTKGQEGKQFFTLIGEDYFFDLQNKDCCVHGGTALSFGGVMARYIEV
jgi:hypothetical protein